MVKEAYILCCLCLLEKKNLLHAILSNWNRGCLNLQSLIKLWKLFFFSSNYTEHIYDVVTCVFQYLEMLRSEEPQEWVFKECQVNN